ncbi:HesA/MoeB/ThiF family protein [Variovorax sp. LARHSF232]
MDDDDLLRYSRHILLEEFGIDGQAKVSAGHALVIGAGGLGSPVALYLAGAGVGQITLVDDDEVDLTNLQRQIAHTAARVGQAKVRSAAEAMGELNPTIQVHAHVRRADEQLLEELVPRADVVIDCSDNFATRQAVNRACVRHGRPLVAGAAIRFDGQLSVYDSRDAASPCYACLFPPDAQFEETRCAVLGVFAPVVGTIGVLQAGEALKLLAGIGEPLAGRLLMFDGRSASFDTLRVARDPHCAVCASRPGHTAKPA